MSDDKKQKEERERQEKEERERYMPTTSISGGGMSIPLGGGIGLNISTGRPTISIGPGLSMDI